VLTSKGEELDGLELIGLVLFRRVSEDGPVAVQTI
jgi:hypothetical protein